MIANPLDTTHCQVEQIESLFKNQQIDVSKLALAFPSQLIYVAQDGSNSNTGTIDSPYATVAFAMTQITTNTVSKPFFIVVVGNITDTTVIALKPNVSIIGVSPGANLSAQITADASWSSAANGSISYLYNLTIASLNFSPNAPVLANFRMYFVIVTGAAALNAATTHTMSAITYNCIFNSTFAVDNISLFTYTNRYLGAVNIAQGTEIANTGFNSNYDSYFTGANTTIGKLGQTFTSQLSLAGCQVLSNLTGRGTAAFKIDAVSRPQGTKALTLNDSATLTLTSVSSSIGLQDLETPNTPYTPTNFTIVTVANTSNSVQGCIEGIDNALAPVGLNPTWQIVTGTSQALVPGNNYFATSNAGLTTFTMPTSMTAGEVISVACGASAGTFGFEILMNASPVQVLNFGNQTTNLGGGGNLQVASPSTDNPNSAVSILCVADNTTFVVLNSQGNFILS